MRGAAVALLLAALLAPLLASAEDITLFKHAYRKQPPAAAPKESAYPKYRVKQGDTLKKIFLKDFGARPEELPSLYRKFRQYNPGVRNLNRIMPDSDLTIPREPGSQRQASTAPVPTGNVIVIKKGQHLAKVLREMYGLSNEAIFRDYIEKIKKLNPDIEDLNLLTEGQKVRLPAIGNEPRKALQTRVAQNRTQSRSSMKPRRLRIVELQEEDGEPGGVKTGGKPAQPAPSSETGAANGQASRPNAGPEAAEAGATPANGETEARKAREREAIEVVRGSLLPVFREMGGRNSDRGTYFLPVAGDRVISIDAADVPVIDLDAGRRIIVDVNNKLSPEARKLIEEAYPSTKIVSGTIGGREALMERVLDACGYFSVNKDAGPVLVGEDEKVRLFGKWVIYKDKSRRNVIVINILSDEELLIPDEIRTYAARFGIRLVEMGGKKEGPRPAVPGGIRGLGQSYEKLFGIMGIACEKDKVLDLVSLESLKISYTAPLIVGKVIIPGDMSDRTMLELLSKSGYRVMDRKTVSLGEVLDALSLKKMGPPVRIVVAKGRAELDLPAVQVGGTTILEHQVDKDIVKYLTSTGLKAIVW